MVAAQEGLQAMQLIQDLSQLAPDGGVVLTMGVFDGVHLGHRHLIGQVAGRARQIGCLSGVITFHPHPAAVIRGECLPILTTAQERLYLIRQLDADLVINMPFTVELSRLTAREFMEFIRQHLRLKELWIGPDFVLGRGREGNVTCLRQLGEEMGFGVHTVPPLVLDGEVVSSTRIRNLLAGGDVARAGRLLGHCFSFSGPVIAGASRGRTLGYPTANLSATADRALPANGIYACRVVIGEPRQFCCERQGQRPGHPLYMAVVNVGTRPTFDNGARLVEAHLLDFAGELYGQTLALHFVERLRGELRFPDAASLIRQIGHDVVHARQALVTDTTCALL
jgi:riboflavin kinase/FMN adenylyltransferase